MSSTSIAFEDATVTLYDLRGKPEQVPYLSERWVLPYHFLPFFPGDTDEMLDLLESDVAMLLKGKYYHFWSQITFDPDFTKFFDTFLRYYTSSTPRVSLQKKVLALIQRMSRDREEHVYITHHSKMLSAVIDLSKLMDIACIYGRVEPEGVQSLFKILFESPVTSDRYWSDWKTTISAVDHILAKILSNFLKESNVMVKAGMLLDDAKYLDDIFFTLSTCVHLYPSLDKSLRLDTLVFFYNLASYLVKQPECAHVVALLIPIKRRVLSLTHRMILAENTLEQLKYLNALPYDKLGFLEGITLPVLPNKFIPDLVRQYEATLGQYKSQMDIKLEAEDEAPLFYANPNDVEDISKIGSVVPLKRSLDNLLEQDALQPMDPALIRLTMRIYEDEYNDSMDDFQPLKVGEGETEAENSDEEGAEGETSSGEAPARESNFSRNKDAGSQYHKNQQYKSRQKSDNASHKATQQKQKVTGNKDMSVNYKPKPHPEKIGQPNKPKQPEKTNKPQQEKPEKVHKPQDKPEKTNKPPPSNTKTDSKPNTNSGKKPQGGGKKPSGVDGKKSNPSGGTTKKGFGRGG